MAKPSNYRETHTLVEDVTYQHADKSGGATYASEGILRQGRVVWSQGQVERAPDALQSVTVYAEGVGLIDLPKEVLSDDRLTSLRR